MSPSECVWETKEATSLSAKNSAGIFDILPDHARFMSLIDSTPITVELSNGSNKAFTFQNALLSCVDNTVSLYVQEDPA